MTINKSEVKYILYAVGFSLVWFLLVIPFLLKGGVENSSVYLQFLVFNIGLFLFLQFFLKAKAMNKSPFSFNKLKSIFGIMVLFIGIDIIVPPFLVSSSGELMNTVLLKAAGSDYVAGYLATNLGLSGIWVFLFTYIIAPAILFLIAAQLLNNFVKEL